MAADEEAKKRMRELSKDPKAVPPQLFNEDTYLGVGREVVCFHFTGNLSIKETNLKPCPPYNGHFKLFINQQFLSSLR